MGESAPQPGQRFYPFLTRCHALKSRKGTELARVTNLPFTFVFLTLSLRVMLPQRRDPVQTGITFIITSSASRAAKEWRIIPNRKSLLALVAVTLPTRAAPTPVGTRGSPASPVCSAR